jgi:serine/threonine-protein kinase
VASVEFRVRPFGSVYVDGAYLGDTPFAAVKLPVGSHQVRVVNKELGKDLVKPFEVKSGSNIYRQNLEE